MFASHFWSAAPLDTGHPATPLIALILLAVLTRIALDVRRRVLRRRLERHWRDVTAILRTDQRPRADVTLPLLALLALVAGSAAFGAVVGVAAMVAATASAFANGRITFTESATTSGDTNVD